MLHVRTFLRLSSIHGIGLFAAEPIPAGATIWQFQPPFDVVFESVHLASIPQFSALRTYCIEDLQRPGIFMLPGDDARFINHSDEPNSIMDGLNRMVAARDITPGEEITENYSDICAMRRARGVDARI